MKRMPAATHAAHHGKKSMLPWAIVALVVLAFLAFGPLSYLWNAPAKPASTPNPILTSATPIPTALPVWAQYPELMERLRNYQSDPYANAVRLCDLPPQVFAKLPPFPHDFYADKLLFHLGKITDLSYYGEDIWKQPEFYPQFDEQGCELHKYPPAGRWAAVGYGSFPSEVIVHSKRTDEYDISFFMHTSWLVQTYQGMSFNVEYPATGTMQLNEFSDGVRSIKVDPAETRKYFTATVSPKEVLLEPAFPVYENGWTQKITVHVKVKDAKPGRYLIGVDLGAPSKEKDQEWLYKYKLNYISAGSQTIGQPWYNMFIEVQ